MDATPLELRVEGPLACFTRPESKVERVSYPVMTPSAARGALEAVFWKPEFTWAIREIRVLKPIRYISLRRNEIRDPQSINAEGPYVASDEENRAQRSTLALREVAYVITADVRLRSHATDHVAKYRDMFRRRVERGQCFQRPYLGCREFAADFGPLRPEEKPIETTGDLGWMLLDQSFDAGEGKVQFRVHDMNGGRWVQGRVQPQFFEARLERGVLQVPLAQEAR